MLLLENNQIPGFRRNSASCQISSHYASVDYFPIKAHPYTELTDIADDSGTACSHLKIMAFDNDRILLRHSWHQNTDLETSSQADEWK